MLTDEGNCYRGKIVYYKTTDLSQSYEMYFGPHNTPGPVKAKMTLWKKHCPKTYTVLDAAVQVSTEWTDV